MASKPSSQNSENVEVIDLTNETTRINNTIVLDDDDDDDDDNDTSISSVSSSFSLLSFKPDSHVNEETNVSSQTLTGIGSEPWNDEPVSPKGPVTQDSDSRASESYTSPHKPKTKKAQRLLQKEEREIAKRLREKQKEEERLIKQANRANAANKVLENCTTIIHKNILNIVKDPEEISLKTLFDESLLKYRLTEYPKEENAISWTIKRTEVENGECVDRFKDSEWIMIIMDGKDYLSKLLSYKKDPNGINSIKTYLSNIRRRTQSNLVILVFELANYLKNERMKDARNYRKTFKDKFEGVRSENKDSGQQDEQSNNLSIGVTELQELRLTLQIEFNHENPDWSFHLEFYEKTCDVIQTLVKYSLSIAKLQVKQKSMASTGLDWAINMDKEKAVDPTKSEEELTKLWTNQLQQFHQVTLPVAKAIASEYPTPFALLDQYLSLDPNESQELLASIYVQRNLKRQVGSSVSNRIYNFMMSQDPDAHLGLG